MDMLVKYLAESHRMTVVVQLKTMNIVIVLVLLPVVTLCCAVGCGLKTEQTRQRRCDGYIDIDISDFTITLY